MTAPAEPVVRTATAGDVLAICAFGERVIPPHYTPLIGARAASGQVRQWWGETEMGSAVAAGLVVVAEAAATIIGVGQRGGWDDEHVVWKLYLEPDHRGHGLGARLLDAIIAQLPPAAERVYIEHFAANERAGAFYEREGFSVDRIEPSANGDTKADTVWRVRRL